MAHRALLCLILFGLFVASPKAHAGRAEPVAQAIAGLVREARLGDGIGIHVVRLHDARELYRKRASRPLNPASNQKLLTAAAALRRLGPTFRATTRVEGTLENGRVEKLVLRAAGDPSLSYARLVLLAQSLRLRGVDEVERIAIDDSYFDEKILPPAFDQQPKEAASFRAAIAAFSVNRNSYVVHVGPGPEVGAKGRVRVLPDEYIELDNATVTKGSGPPKIHIDHQTTEDGSLRVRVRGEIRRTTRTLYYRRRVPSPRTHSASLWVRALRQVGMRGSLSVEYQAVEEELPPLGDMPSGPLSTLLYPVGKWSDNFTAEMVLKIMGAEAQKPGSSAKGLQVVRQELESMGVNTEGLVMVNGSGLFDGNRIAPQHITQTLVAAYRDPAIRAEYLSQLAVAGSDGTLQRRLNDLPRPRMVRAKTGTLRDVIALSGFVLGEPEHSVAFSFLANGITGKQGEARQLADDIVRALAEYAVQPAPNPAE